ncbi:MAG: hypothetical protein M3380_12880 [Chloroflexota bacterium]|nr:hypothetical protein [Chloroflexota bacterium]
MKLLKIGDRFINLDLVTEFTFDASGVTIWYDHDHTTTIMAHYEVQLLHRWLEAQALDIAQELPDTGDNADVLQLDLLPGTPDVDGMLD